MKRTILLFLTTINLSYSALAEEGCLFNGRMYYGGYTLYNPILNPAKRFYDVSSYHGNVSNTCPANNSNFYAIYTSKVTFFGFDINCGTGPANSTNYAAATGVVYNFNYIQCPLDDFSFLLVVIFSVIGVIVIKKCKFCMMM